MKDVSFMNSPVRIICILLFIFINQNFYPQTKINNKTTSNIDSLYEYCAALELKGEWDKVIPILKEKIKEFKNSDATNGKAKLQSMLAGIIWKQGKHEEALTLLDEAEKLSKTFKDEKTLAEIYYNFGEIYYIKRFIIQEDVGEKDLKFHNKSLELRKTINDKKGITHSLSRIGVIYERVREFDKALEYYNEAIKISEEINYKQGMTRPFTHIGVYYDRKGDYETALNYYKKALDINRELKAAEPMTFDYGNVGLAMLNLDKDYKAALDYFTNALTIAEKIDFKLAISRTLYLIGSLYKEKGMNEKAASYFKRSADSVRDINYKSMVALAENSIQSLHK